MDREDRDLTAEVTDELVRIIRATPEGVLAALDQGRASEDLAAVTAVKCKRSADGACEWEVKLADKLKAIELYLKYRGGGGEEPLTTGFVVDYDYG